MSNPKGMKPKTYFINGRGPKPTSGLKPPYLDPKTGEFVVRRWADDKEWEAGRHIYRWKAIDIALGVKREITIGEGKNFYGG